MQLFKQLSYRLFLVRSESNLGQADCFIVEGFISLNLNHKQNQRSALSSGNILTKKKKKKKTKTT